MWLLSPRSEAQASGCGCTCSIFMQILIIFSSPGARLTKSPRSNLCQTYTKRLTYARLTTSPINKSPTKNLCQIYDKFMPKLYKTNTSNWGDISQTYVVCRVTIKEVRVCEVSILCIEKVAYSKLTNSTAVSYTTVFVWWSLEGAIVFLR